MRLVFNKILVFNSFCVCNLRLVLRSTLSFLGIQGNLVPVSHSPLCYIGGMGTPLYNPKTRPPYLLSCPPDGNGQRLGPSVPSIFTSSTCDGHCPAMPGRTCLRLPDYSRVSALALLPPWPSTCREGPLQMPCPRRRRGHSALQMRMYRGEGLRPRRANCHVE